MFKILIVEDEEYLSDMYKIKFEQEGYGVVVAKNGEEGVELAAKERPDLVLLDLVMPGMDGFQVLAELKKNPDTAKLKVYILSNLGQSDEVNLGIKTGADGYFIKANLTPGQLTEKVNAIFSQPVKANKISHDREMESEAVEKKAAKILLIEDEDPIVAMYKMRFAKAGYEVETAKNGAWGIKLAKQKKFDLILLDMIMPAMSGYDAIKILKIDASTKNVPIIILSNSAQDNEVVEAKKLGAAACLIKSSLTPAKLVKEVEKILNF